MHWESTNWVLALGIGSALVGCTQLLGADSEYVLGAGGGEIATSSRAASGVGGAASSGSEHSSTASGNTGGAEDTSATTASTTTSTSSGGSRCPATTLRMLPEDFEVSPLNTALWSTTQTNGGAVRLASGSLNFTLDGRTGGAATCFSLPPYRSLEEDCGATIRVENLLQPSDVSVYFQVSDRGENAAVITQVGKYINFELYRPSRDVVYDQIEYSPTLDLYWGIELRGDDVIWITSKDGASWVIQFSKRLTASEFPRDNLEINFGVTGSGRTIGEVHFDDVNLP